MGRYPHPRPNYQLPRAAQPHFCADKWGPHVSHAIHSPVISRGCAESSVAHTTDPIVSLGTDLFLCRYLVGLPRQLYPPFNHFPACSAERSPMDSASDHASSLTTAPPQCYKTPSQISLPHFFSFLVHTPALDHLFR